MRVAVDTSASIAVIADEPEKARLIELTKDAIIVAPPSTYISLDKNLIDIARKVGVQVIEV